jgi:chromosomal replication initiator protein
VAQARQVAMYLARELTDHSLPEIGRGIGGRNHTTVLHAVNSVSSSMRSDASVRNAVDNLRRRLEPPR